MIKLKHLNHANPNRLPILAVLNIKNNYFRNKISNFLTMTDLAPRPNFRRPAQAAFEGISHPGRRTFDERRRSVIANNHWPRGAGLMIRNRTEIPFVNHPVMMTYDK